MIHARFIQDVCTSLNTSVSWRYFFKTHAACVALISPLRLLWREKWCQSVMIQAKNSWVELIGKKSRSNAFLGWIMKWNDLIDGKLDLMALGKIPVSEELVFKLKVENNKFLRMLKVRILNNKIYIELLLRNFFCRVGLKNFPENPSTIFI